MTRWRTTTIVVALVTLWLVSTAGAAAAPVLLSSHPVVLAVLTPRAAFVAAAALHLPPWTFVVLFVTRLSLGDPLHYALGRAHGGSWLRWLSVRSPGCAGGLERAERLVRRVGLPVTALVPTGSVMAVAGAVGLSFRASMTLNLFGTLVRVLLLWLAARTAPDLVLSFGDAAAIAAPAAVMMLLVGAARRRHRRSAVEAARDRHPTLTGASLGGHLQAV